MSKAWASVHTPLRLFTEKNRTEQFLNRPVPHNKDFMELQPVAQPVQPVAQPVAQPVKSSSSSDTKWAIEPRQSGMLELVIIGLWCQ